MPEVFSTLRMRVTAGLFALVAVALAAYFLTLHPYLRDLLLNVRGAEVGVRASSIASTINRQLESAARELESIAALPETRSLDVERVSSIFNNLERTSSTFRTFSALSESGSAVSGDSSPAFGSSDESLREFIRTVMREQRTGIAEPLAVADGTFEGVIGTPLSSNDGAMVGVLLGALRSGQDEPLYQPITRSSIPSGWHVFLVSRQSYLLAEAGSEAAASTDTRSRFDHPLLDSPRTDLEPRIVDRVGQRWLAAAARVPVADWTVIVEGPESLAVTQINSVIRPLALFILLFVLAFLLLALMTAGHFIKPLESLTSALRGFGQGQAELVPTSGSDEVSLALRAFNEMVVERRRTDDALRLSEERYRDLVENASDLICTHEVDGMLTSINRAGEQILGYNRDQALRMNASQLFGPAYIEVVNRLLRGGQSVSEDASCELVLSSRDGRLVTLEVSVRVISRDGRPVGIKNIARDITARRQLEQEVRHSQRMEAIGRLAGGVAHDFNNMLTVITGYSELIMIKVGPHHPVYHDAEEIRKASERAAALTHQLLAFSGKQVLQSKILDLNEVIESLKPMLQKLIGEHIVLATVPAADLWRAKADPAQIEQVIMNLAVNAREAMQSGGELTIKTSNFEEGVRYQPEAQSELDPDEYVRMTVSDTGGGIDENTRSHIFEPFFTTKGFGKGTGLGLSTVYGIVKQSGGHITVESELGVGTTFNIYLPRAESSNAAPSVDRMMDRAGGTGVVLIAEDEEAVRGLARSVLESVGYTVLEAQDGIEALRVVEEYGATINLLLTDVIMPRMGGRELADRLLKASPEVRVVFMSGYTDDAMVPQGPVTSGTFFVNKPFSPETLLNTVAEALSAT